MMSWPMAVQSCDVVAFVSAVKQERAELCKRESIEKFDKDQLKKTNTVEKNPLPDPQGTQYHMAYAYIHTGWAKKTGATLLYSF